MTDTSFISRAAQAHVEEFRRARAEASLPQFAQPTTRPEHRSIEPHTVMRRHPVGHWFALLQHDLRRLTKAAAPAGVLDARPDERRLTRHLHDEQVS
jgi:hypothetical protein